MGAELAISLPALGAVLAALAACVYVLLPLVRPSRRREERRVEELARQRSAIYRQVLDLEFDYRTGKLAEADYREQSAALLAEAARLLALSGGAELDLDARLEQEIAAARASLAGSHEPTSVPTGREA
jgi:hypothetical protein